MTDKNKHIPQGYKDSPLGIIPKEWEVKRLGDCFEISAGRDLERDFYSSTKTSKCCYPIFSNSLENKGLYGYTSQPRHKGNSITITGRGTLGHAEYRTEDYDAIIRLLVLSPKIEISCKLISDYINYTTPFIYESTGVPQLTAPQIKSTKLLLPPYKEQQGIVEVLQLWDTAIEKQLELIEKLKLRKRALMQQLLTGKKRLLSFSGEWKEVKLGDVSTFLRNNTLSREQLNDDDGVINNIHYGDVLIKYPSIIDCQKEKLQYINDGVSILTDYVENGDVIMSDTAEDETVGRVCEVQNVGNKKILAGLHTMLIRPHDKLFAPYFLGYYLNSEAYHKQLIPLIQGIKVCSIGKVAVQNTVLTIPSLEEQRIIASVLVKADKEIELAKEKLANLQSQKRGLMQQLLTGKKRII